MTARDRQPALLAVGADDCRALAALVARCACRLGAASAGWCLEGIAADLTAAAAALEYGAEREARRAFAAARDRLAVLPVADAPRVTVSGAASVAALMGRCRVASRAPG